MARIKAKIAGAWVNIGSTGATGPQGATGAQGAQGVQGVSGVDGIGSPLILGAAVSSTVTALADVSEWRFDVTAGKSYRIEIVATYQTAVATTGGKLAVYLPSGAGSIHGFMEGAISSAVVATELKATIRVIGSSNAAGSSLLTTGVNAINTPHYIGGTMIFNCTTSGVFRAQWASEIASTAAQLNAGSVMIVTLLN